jgi:succinyl-CoA synthetase beta subunit
MPPRWEAMTREVRDAARDLLGKRLVTLQTGPEGKPVQRVYVETADPFERELYPSRSRAASRTSL